VNLVDIVPHRGKMLLLDRVESWDAAKGVLVASFTVREDCIFFDRSMEGLPSWVSVELMAQASAACAGAHDLEAASDKPPRPGLLLGSRKVAMPRAVYRLGEKFTVVATAAFHDDESGAFECEIRDSSGELAASCILTAYRPPDFIGFLRSGSEGTQAG